MDNFVSNLKIFINFYKFLKNINKFTTLIGQLFE